MMRWVVLVILMFLSLLLESTVFGALSIGGIQPDIVLVLVIFFSLFSGSQGGAFFGFLGGLAQDALLGQFLGMNALTKMVIGYTVSRIERNVYRDQAFIPVLLVAVLSVLNQVLIYFISAAFIPMPPLLTLLVRVFIPGAGYNCILAAITYSRFRHSITRGWLKTAEY